MRRKERDMKKRLWNKDFVLLLQGSAVSTIGDLMYSVAIGYWVYEKTGSSALMGIMSSISMFVTMFLSPFCGSIVDKINRKWLIVGIDVMQGAVMLGVGALAYLNSLSVPIVIVAAFVASFGSVFYSPAISTLMIDIIPRDDMVRGQSIYSGGSSLIDLVGTAFSGAMVALFGVPLIVVINGISNLYSALSELFIKVPRTVQQGERVTVKSVIGDSISAVRTVMSDKCLKLFVPFVLILNLIASGAFTLLLPFCLEKGFDVDAYGYLAAVFSAGSLLAVLCLGVIKLNAKSRYLVMSIGFILSIAFMLATYLAQSIIPMCIFGFISGMLNATGNSVFNATLMLALPEENRSAILGFLRSACVGGQALSAVIYGFLGEIFPLYITFACGSVISLIPMIYMCSHRVTKEFILENCE